MERELGVYWRTLAPDGSGGVRLAMEMDSWGRGERWRHGILLVEPARPLVGHMCYLEVTGQDAGEADLAYARALADETGVSVAFLFDIPNQPYCGMVEDDLIAHTFEEYVATGDAEWPLLVPMVRSVLGAMEALVDWSVGRFTGFVVGGASKRGWTSWLTAALGDSRVKGIVPLVFDNLHMSAQVRHQMRIWGGTSPMLDDYSRRRLTELATTAEGDSLLRMVDPWFHLERMRCPALVVNGSNDPYWAVDALTHYYKRLPRGSAVQVVPNMGHSVGHWDWRLSSVGAFVRRCAGAELFPTVRFDWGQSERHLELTAECDIRPLASRVWGAANDGFWFAEAEFFVDFLEGPEVRIPSRGHFDQAVFMELEFDGEWGPYRLTSPVFVIPRSG